MSRKIVVQFVKFLTNPCTVLTLTHFMFYATPVTKHVTSDRCFPATLVA